MIYFQVASVEQIEQSQYLRYQTWLAPQERERAHRLSRPDLRKRFVVGRALLRFYLAQRLGVTPAQVPIGIQANGRPGLNGQMDKIDFNLSHSGAYVACAVIDAGKIGIDIEWCGRQRDFVGLAARYFHPFEMQQLQACEAARVGRLFYQFWTLKEAYAKAQGSGLSTALLREIYFDCRTDVLLHQVLKRRLADDTIPACGDSTTFSQFRPFPDTVAALAWQSSMSQGDPQYYFGAPGEELMRLPMHNSR